MTEGEYKHDGVEDIRKIEIVAVKELKHMISEGNVENAGTLIGYLLCCMEYYDSDNYGQLPSHMASIFNYDIAIQRSLQSLNIDIS